MGKTLALLDQFQNYREILNNRPSFVFLSASEKWMSFSFRELCPWPPDHGLCSWTPLGALPPDPNYRLAQSTRYSVPQAEFLDPSLGILFAARLLEVFRFRLGSLPIIGCVPGAYLGGSYACPHPLEVKKFVLILMWKNYAKIWTFIHTWNVPLQISKYATVVFSPSFAIVLCLSVPVLFLPFRFCSVSVCS